MRWFEISSNPDNTDVVSSRAESVISSYVESLPTYPSVIQKYLTGLNVLDFGAANHSIETSPISPNNTHGIVARISSRTTAVDIVKIPMCSFPEKCTHLTVDLFENSIEENGFDVFFAGHVIEHVDSPHKIFSVANKLLKESGGLLVVTPNPLWIVGILARLKGKNLSVNVDHAALFGASELIELGERENMQIINWGYCGSDEAPPRLGVRSLRSMGYNFATIAFLELLYKFFLFKKSPLINNGIFAFFKKV